MMTGRLLPLCHARAFRRGLILLLAGLMVACASEEERFAEHMARSEAYREKGQVKEAAIELRSALKIKPQSALVNELIADLYRESGQFENALFFYREAQRLDPQRIEPLLREFQLVLGDDLERAIAITRLALELAPDDPRVHQRRSEVALIGGSTDRALDAALTAIELAPDDPASQMSLGTVYQAMMREQRLADEEVPEELFQSAIDAFELADSGAWTVQARVEKARTLASWPGRREEASAAFQAALESAIELEDRARRLLIAEEIAARARRLGETEMEREALEAIIGLQPEEYSSKDRLALGDPKTRYLRAWSELTELADREDPGTGSAVLERLLEERPEDPQAHLVYARYLSAQGRVDEALAHLETTASQGIEPEVFLDEAVRLALEARDLQRARQYVERLGVEHPGSAGSLLANARLAISMGRSAEAAELLERVNEIEESADSQRLRALAELRSADLATAQQAVSRSLELEPRNPASLRLQSQIYFQGGDWMGVIRTLRRLGATGVPLRADDRMLVVRPLYELGRDQEARVVLDTLLKLDPPPEAAIAAYVRYESGRDPQRATRLLDEALARSPGNPALISTAAAFDLRTGNIDLALERLRRGLEAQPNSPQLLAVRAQVLARGGRLEEAERDARQAFERSPGMPGLLELVLSIYRQQGRIDFAIEQLEASESAGLLGPSHRVLLGRLHLTNGETDRAEELYEAALAEDPGLAAAKNDLAYLLAREKRDLDRALELALEAQQEFGDVPQVLDTLGMVMLQRGLAGPAAEQFGSALRLAEEKGEAPALLYYHMGLALRALGQEEAAEKRLEQALSIDPEFESAEDARRQLEAARAASSESEAPAS